MTVKTLKIGLYLLYFMFCPVVDLKEKQLVSKQPGHRKHLEDVPCIREPIEKLRANTLVNVCMSGMWHKFCAMDLVDKELLLPGPNTPEGSQHQEPTISNDVGTLQG